MEASDRCPRPRNTARTRPFGVAAELAAAVSQHAQELDIVLLEEWQHTVIEQIGRRDGRLAVVELGKAYLGVGVDKGAASVAGKTAPLAFIVKGNQVSFKVPLEAEMVVPPRPRWGVAVIGRGDSARPSCQYFSLFFNILNLIRSGEPSFRLGSGEHLSSFWLGTCACARCRLWGGGDHEPASGMLPPQVLGWLW